jgi:3-deoxy-D-manno-octulosonic-acid transferase
VETELWPNLLHAARAGGVRVVLLNGRLAGRKMDRYRWLSGLYRPLLEQMARVGAQSAEDAARFVELGAGRDRLAVTGNVKYDLPVPEVGAPELRRRLGLADERPVFVAGSTAAGEEEAVLEAFDGVRERLPDLLLVLAPRRLSRIDEVETWVRTRELRVGRLSALEAGAAALDVLLVDTMGLLFALYQLASVAFVGGSLAPVGGHNVLEPAAVGVPVLFGPHTENSAEPARALEQAGGGIRVSSARQLGHELDSLFRDPARRADVARRASQVVLANRGAMERSLGLLFDALAEPGRGPRTGVA